MSDHQMMSNRDRLIYMADQIARNFIALGHDHAIEATADHIAMFWDPRMKAQIHAIFDDQPALLPPIVQAAVERLVGGHTSSQTPATTFNAVREARHSDAG